MKKLLLLLLIGILTLTACKSVNDKTVTKAYDPCIDGRDTTFYIDFTKDTSTKDFYQLLNFIESKGAFNRFNKKYGIDSSTGNSIFLHKVLCEKMDFESPIERWVLRNVFSIRYFMTSHIPVKGTTDYFPKFDITQYNFISAGEKDKALVKIKEIGWGDPLKKWNDYYIVTSKSRIIILESGARIFTETKNKYGEMIQKEWADKYNN